MFEGHQDVRLGVVGGGTAARGGIGHDADPAPHPVHAVLVDAVQVHVLAVLEAQFGDVLGVDHHHVAALLDAPVAVVVAVDGGVPLVVGAEGLEDQCPFRPFEGLEGIDGQHGLARGRVEGPRIPGAVRQDESALLADAGVVVLATLDHAGDVVADEVVVLFEAGPVGVELVPDRRPREPAHDRRFREQGGGNGLHAAPGGVDGADGVLDGDELLAGFLDVDLGAAPAGQDQCFLARDEVGAVELDGDLGRHLEVLHGSRSHVGVRYRRDQVPTERHEHLDLAVAHSQD